MKKTIIFIFALVLLLSCNKLKLSEEEAKKILISDLQIDNLEIKERVSQYTWTKNGETNADVKLKNAGLKIQTGSDWVTGYTYFQYSDEAMKFQVDAGDELNGKGALWRMFTVSIDSIQGILINNDDKTATVKYSIKLANISPIAKAVFDNCDKTILLEAKLKYFDTGWKTEESSKIDINKVLIENNLRHTKNL